MPLKHSKAGTGTPLALEIGDRDLTNRVCCGEIWMVDLYLDRFSAK
jgi:hypothetical protein